MWSTIPVIWSTIPVSYRKLDHFPPELWTTSTGTADRFAPESLDHLHRNPQLHRLEANSLLWACPFSRTIPQPEAVGSGLATFIEPAETQIWFL